MLCNIIIAEAYILATTPQQPKEPYTDSNTKSYFYRLNHKTTRTTWSYNSNKIKNILARSANAGPIV